MPVLLWLRNGSGKWAAIPLVAFIWWTCVTTQPWRLEFDWGARYTGAAVLLFSPMVAAATAYDVSRGLGRPYLDLAQSRSRGVWASLSCAAAVATWAIIGMTLGWVGVAAVVWRAAGQGSRDPWIYAEVASAILASAAIGVVCGAFIDGLLSVGVAAGVVLLLGSLTSGKGASLFQLATTSGTLIGLDRTPARALALVGANLTVCAGAAVGLMMKGRAIRAVDRWLLGVGALGTSVILAIVFLPYRESEFRPTMEEATCVGHLAQVCGPQSAHRLLNVAEEDLSSALIRLRPAGLALPSHFAVARGDAVAHLDSEATLLDLDTSAMVDGHLSADLIAATLSAPRVCAGFGGGPDLPDLLANLELTRVWVLTQLEAAPAQVSPAPSAVEDAFDRLNTCPTV